MPESVSKFEINFLFCSEIFETEEKKGEESLEM